MADKLVLPEHDFSIDLKDAGYGQRRSYDAFLEYFKEDIPNAKIESSIKKFERERNILWKALRQSLSILKGQPLLTAFLIWSKYNFVKPGFPDYAKMLVEKNILNFKDKNGRILIINDLQDSSLYNILEGIRCRQDIEVWHREMLVLTFIDFVRWMKVSTQLSAINFADRDREKVSRRYLDYDEFIRFLAQLDDKCQLVAKLLFFGGSRTLTEILNLKVKDVDFAARSINFDAQSISYPRHVLDGVMTLIEGKKKSDKIFSRKNKIPLSSVTIFRNFKEASLKLGLDHIYTPKTLTTDI